MTELTKVVNGVVMPLTEYDLAELKKLQDNAIPEKWNQIRLERNVLLSECDWTQVADAPVDKLAWATYRQSLRDITLQSDPFNIVWPSAPV